LTFFCRVVVPITISVRCRTITWIIDPGLPLEPVFFGFFVVKELKLIDFK
jgi:hypothetical protein